MGNRITTRQHRSIDCHAVSCRQDGKPKLINQTASDSSIDHVAADVARERRLGSQASAAAEADLGDDYPVVESQRIRLSRTDYRLRILGRSCSYAGEVPRAAHVYVCAKTVALEYRKGEYPRADVCLRGKPRFHGRTSRRPDAKGMEVQGPLAGEHARG